MSWLMFPWESEAVPVVIVGEDDTDDRRVWVRPTAWESDDDPFPVRRLWLHEEAPDAAQ